MSDDSSWRPPPAGGPPPPPPPSPPAGGTLPLPPEAPPAPPTVGPPGSLPGSLPGSPPGPPPGPPPGSDPVEPEPASSGRRRGPLLLVVIGVLAIGAAGVFAVTQFLGGSQGGAASPEDLGEQVIDAIDATDPLGLIDLLVPNERDVVREPLTDLVTELRRLGIVSPGAGVDGIEGVEFAVSRTSVRVLPTNVDDITNLRIRGDLTVTVDGRSLPVGDLLTDNISDLDLAELDLRETEPFDIRFTAIEIDDRWYLSTFFSLAELARSEQSPVPDIPGTGIEPTGGTTPEGAVEAMLDAVEALDLEGMIAALNPGEAGVLHRYGPLFLGDAQDELDLVPLRWEITESEIAVSGSGSTRSAAIERLVIEGRLDGVDIELSFDDGCFRGSADGDTFDSCAPDVDDFSVEDFIGESSAGREVVELLEEMFADYEAPGITLRQTDGRWFVSPLGTVFDQFLAVLRAIERDELERLIELVPEAFDEVFGSFGDPFDFDDDFFDDDFSDGDFSDDDFSDDDFSDGDFSDGDFSDDDFFDSSAVDECFGLADATDAIQCFEAAAASEDIEAWMIPVEMRFPECGAAEAYWNGYVTLGDDEFIAFVTEVRPCFVALVESGRLEDFELPLAMSEVECFEDRNWFNVFDDPDYDDRFYECAGL